MSPAKMAIAVAVTIDAMAGTGGMKKVTGTNSASFAQSNNCGNALPPGARCTINVTFAPIALGDLAAQVTTTHNATGGYRTVKLDGTGVQPVASLSPVSLSFLAQPVNTTSAPQTVTLSNTGTGTLTLSGITLGGGFAQTNNCGGSVAPKKRCTISVTFTPTAVGPSVSTLVVTDNSVNGAGWSTLLKSMASSSGGKYSAINNSDRIFRNITIELLNPQVEARNVCGPVILDVGFAVCEPAPGSWWAMTEFETRGLKLDHVVLSPNGKYNEKISNLGFLVVGLAGSDIKINAKGIPPKTLHEGGIEWFDAGSKERFSNSGTKATEFLKFTFKRTRQLKK